MPEKTRYGSLAVRIYRRLIDPLLWPLRPKVVRICRQLGARDVLDVASATGAQCRALGRAGIRATGIDLSEEMIWIARRIGGRNVRYVHGSAYALPFEDGSFDASLLLLALHEHTEDERTAMVSEALRIVRPSGHLLLADYTRPRLAAIHPPWQAIRLIEGAAGREHSAGFGDFVARGGLDGLVGRHRLDVLARTPTHFGAIGIVSVAAPAVGS
jgi:SAM-dependent methyltransferase